MKYDISYAIACNIGKMRNINQDNFWCNGRYLEIKNNGLETTESGVMSIENHPVFAVFDGMGGEQHGEIAAHLAASTFDNSYKSSKFSDIKEFFAEACKSMNNNIVNYENQNQIGRMGTTAAIVGYDENTVCICNIGDSKIYQFSNNKITQISTDHVVNNFSERKSPLSQHLGISEIEFIIEPYIASGIAEKDDRFLICSDGLTDMIPEKEIESIISKNKLVEVCVNTLLDVALERGGKDNITIILCQINKRSTGLLNKLLKSKKHEDKK